MFCKYFGKLIKCLTFSKILYHTLCLSSVKKLKCLGSHQNNLNITLFFQTLSKLKTKSYPFTTI